jgi:hypothetical protein
VRRRQQPQRRAVRPAQRDTQVVRRRCWPRTVQHTTGRIPTRAGDGEASRGPVPRPGRRLPRSPADRTCRGASAGGGRSRPLRRRCTGSVGAPSHRGASMEPSVMQVVLDDMQRSSTPGPLDRSSAVWGGDATRAADNVPRDYGRFGMAGSPSRRFGRAERGRDTWAAPPLPGPPTPSERCVSRRCRRRPRAARALRRTP